LIEFIQRNSYFAQNGFYKGFGDLLFNAVLSDPRASSDIWLVSVLLKISTLGVTDPFFLEKVEKLMDANVERFLNQVLVKFIILLYYLSTVAPKIKLPQERPVSLMTKHKALILRKVRS
jgi:hypothetical protein